MEGDVKTEHQLLVEMEERLESAKQRLQEADELLQSEIRERKRTEETFAQTQKYAESIVETIREPLLVLTADLKVISANRSFFQTFQVKPEETEGRFIYSIGNHQWDIPALRKLLEEIVPTNSQFNGFEVDHEFPIIGRKAMLLNARRIYREGKGTEMILLAIEDVTERKQMEEALKDSEVRFRRLFETARDGILILDAGTGQISDVNPFLIEMLGYLHDQFLGKQLWEIGAFTDIQEAKVTFSELQTKGYVRYEDLPLQTKDGRLIDVEFVSNVYLVDHKKVIQCNIRDITKRKQLEKELRKSYDELEARIQERTAELAQRNEALTIEIDERLKMEQALLESKEQLRILAAQVLSAQENERKRIALEVHDVLGSNLSAIKFKAEESLQYLTLNEISSISKPLETLIPIVLDTIEETRRIQADLRPPHLDDLGIVATLSWFCRRFKTIYSGIEIEPEVTIREEEVPDHLKIVLFRITQEAMNNIGKHAKADSVYLGLRKVEGAIELYIKDNGKGFDPEDLSSREIPAKGLGLSSMKERIEFLNGSFSIESAKGKGTVVRAVCPV